MSRNSLPSKLTEYWGGWPEVDSH